MVPAGFLELFELDNFRFWGSHCNPPKPGISVSSMGAEIPSTHWRFFFSVIKSLWMTTTIAVGNEVLPRMVSAFFLKLSELD